MSLQDKQKWDKKYLAKPMLLLPRDASFNLQKHTHLLTTGKALDLACGNGRNTMYLAENGFLVDALDIAQLAVDTLSVQLKTKKLEDKVNLLCMDLDEYSFEQDSYDLVVMANFLDRGLVEKAKKALKTGGVFFVETYMQDENNEKEIFKETNLLQANELKEIFNDFKILFYDEFDNEKHEIYKMKKQCILAKRMHS